MLSDRLSSMIHPGFGLCYEMVIGLSYAGCQFVIGLAIRSRAMRS